MARIVSEFEGAGSGYLAACTGGLPPSSAVLAAQDDLALWRSGAATPLHYDAAVTRVRSAFARIAGVDPARVAIGSQTSAFVAMIAASVPDGAEVLCVDGDFSSVVFPFLQHERRGVRVRHVPLAALPDAVSDETWLVAYSLVQSATGEVADARSIRAAADRAGARVLCDATQAAGWLPLESWTADAIVCHTYKWLCAPRGVCLLAVDEDFARELIPVQAGWYAGDDPWASCYGPSAPLATDARRFDVSPAWQAMAGAAPALELFAETDIHAVFKHDVTLADALSEAVGTDARGSAIVTWHDPDREDLARMTAAGIVASGRAGRARVAFHVWNDESDLDRVLRALAR
ncbi:aminotransferase class V-fold PLP-dependent enzyme [Humibacter ginsenosidimutans]|uniref:aminotransferase class V-fold PLP-dependent enzyme n=1 Tax=Humibacter ginsenosidimutans TaxID=2599293 RepID=UPI001FEFC930|nr:aminotransferase class V-fold PLP-dependent enzyme [Humibacter ginsenosidimutans]